MSVSMKQMFTFPFMIWDKVVLGVQYFMLLILQTLLSPPNFPTYNTSVSCCYLVRKGVKKNFRTCPLRSDFPLPQHTCKVKKKENSILFSVFFKIYLEPLTQDYGVTIQKYCFSGHAEFLVHLSEIFLKSTFGDMSH